MKKITINAGKSSLNYTADLNKLRGHLYGFLFSLKRMPEYELKWAIRDNIEPHIRKLINMMRE